MARKLSFAAPFLVAIFTVVSLYAGNADRLEPGQMVTPMVFALAVAGLFLLLFWLFRPTNDAAPLVASAFTVSFLIWHTMPWYILIMLLVVTLLIGVWGKRSTAAGTLFLCLILAFAIITSGAMVVGGAAGKEAGGASIAPLDLTPGQPNIYFVVPDRMPSFASMRESGIDPENELAELRALGFYVNENQLSADPYTVDYTGEIHTTRTMRFFASALNGGQSIPMEIGYQDCRALIKENAAFKQLHAEGYRIINVASWFAETSNFPEADLNLTYQNVSFLERLFQNELSVAYFERTILYGLNFRVWESDSLQRRVETGRLEWQAENITETAKSGATSTFVFAHLLCPHEPYVFADPKMDTATQYRVNIAQMKMWLYQLARDIRASDPSAIIIIQSDEGMAYRKPIELNNELSPVQWDGVFTAWYFGGYVFTDDLDEVKHTEILNEVISNIKDFNTTR